MHQPLVLTVIGEDRPGLVESIASCVSNHRGNWLDSRMSRLGGKFAGILRMQLPAEEVDAFGKEIEALKDNGLSIHIHQDSEEKIISEGEFILLDIVGNDRPGIVKEVSKVLSSNGINVEELQTECSSAPMSGEILFNAQAKLSLPDSYDVEDLRAALENIANDLMVDISIQ